MVRQRRSCRCTGSMVHVKRMWLDEVSEEAERKMVQEELPRALHYLKGITNFQCAVFGCTSASAANGREGMLAIEKTMQDALGCPVQVVGTDGFDLVDAIFQTEEV